MFNDLVRIVCALSRTAIILVNYYIDDLYLTILHESKLLALRTRYFLINLSR